MKTRSSCAQNKPGLSDMSPQSPVELLDKSRVRRGCSLQIASGWVEGRMSETDNLRNNRYDFVDCLGYSRSKKTRAETAQTMAYSEI